MKFEILWDVADTFFRVFVFIVVMGIVVEEGSTDFIWSILAYLSGIIFMLSPLKKIILEDDAYGVKTE